MMQGISIMQAFLLLSGGKTVFRWIECIYTYITPNFCVFVWFVVNYVAWPASNSLANCRPVPMYLLLYFQI